MELRESCAVKANCWAIIIYVEQGGKCNNKQTNIK